MPFYGNRKKEDPVKLLSSFGGFLINGLIFIETNLNTKAFTMANDSPQDELLILRINEFLEENISDENYGVAELLASLGISRTHLHRRLKATTGKSTSTYIREFRLKKAHEMLKNDVGTVSEIAYGVGFSSPSYFSTAFKKLYIYSPGETKLQNDLAIPSKKKSKLPLSIGIAILFACFLGY